MHNYCVKFTLRYIKVGLGSILELQVEAGNEFKNARPDDHDKGLFSFLLIVYTLLLDLVKDPVARSWFTSS